VKALVIFVILATAGIIFFQFSRKKELKKLLISLGTFGIIISLAVVGNLTRPVMPIYVAHIILVMVAWGGLINYLFRKSYLWQLIFSPIVTIGLFLILEYLEGSRHGILG